MYIYIDRYIYIDMYICMYIYIYVYTLSLVVRASNATSSAWHVPPAM